MGTKNNNKKLVEYKIKIKDDFFNQFIDVTETRYFIWRNTEIKCGGVAGQIISFIWKILDNYPK